MLITRRDQRDDDDDDDEGRSDGARQLSRAVDSGLRQPAGPSVYLKYTVGASRSRSLPLP